MKKRSKIIRFLIIAAVIHFIIFAIIGIIVILAPKISPPVIEAVTAPGIETR